MAKATSVAQFYDSEPQAAFWRRHVRIGVTLYVVGALGVLSYALSTPGGRNRVALIAIDLVSVGLSLTILRWWGLRLVTTKWREPFFFWWSAGTMGFIGTAAALDGGTHSPLSYLLLLPLLFGGLAYAPKYVIYLAIVAVAGAATIGSSTPNPQAAATLLMVLATGIAGLLTVGGAISREKLTDQLVELAALDSMTGCLAHRPFHMRINEEVERANRYGRTFGLVMVDVDNLKQLNDSSGHHAGDEALRAVSRCLLSAARASDVVGRLGGDEFAVLLPEADGEQITGALERLREALASVSEGSFGTTVSLGSTVWLGPDDGALDMLARADDALYAAKHAGRDRYIAWEPSIIMGGRAAVGASIPFDVDISLDLDVEADGAVSPEEAPV